MKTKTGIKDLQGKEIVVGDLLRTKWGGVGTVVYNQGTNVFDIAFESGNYMSPLTVDNVQYRELVIIQEEKSK